MHAFDSYTLSNLEPKPNPKLPDVHNTLKRQNALISQYKGGMTLKRYMEIIARIVADDQSEGMPEQAEADPQLKALYAAKIKYAEGKSITIVEDPTKLCRIRGYTGGEPKLTLGSGYLPVEFYDEQNHEWFPYDINDADKLDRLPMDWNERVYRKDG